jgi:hypothetical protein
MASAALLSGLILGEKTSMPPEAVGAVKRILK